MVTTVNETEKPTRFQLPSFGVQVLTGLVLVLWTVSRVVRSLSGEGAEGVAVEAVAEAEGAPAVAAGEAEWIGGPEATETDAAELDETPPP